MKTTLKMFFAIFIIVLVVSFIVQNPQLTGESFAISYFGHQTAPVPLPIIILSSVLLGSVLVLGAAAIEYVGLKRTIRQQERKIQHLEQELNSLRNLPILGDNKKTESSPGQSF